MITVTYQSRKYCPDWAVQRYVRADTDGRYAWCDTDIVTRFDVRQGRCDAADLPDDVRAAADAQAGQAFGYVEWPCI